MTTKRRPLAALIGIAAAAATFIILASFGQAAAAGNRYVAPAGADAGDCSNSGSPCATVAYALGQASAGDTIHIADGTYAGAGNQNVVINKAITLDGNSLATIFDPDTNVTSVFEVYASNVTIRDMTLQGVTAEGLTSWWAVRLYQPTAGGGALANILFDNVHFLNNASRGIELHNSTTVTGLVIQNCVFDGNEIGIRLASSNPMAPGATVDGMTINTTEFKNQSKAGLYQHASSGIRDLNVLNSTFDSNTEAAIRVSELRESSIVGNTFTGNGIGVHYDDAFGTSAAPNTPGASGDVEIDDNDFIDQTGASVLVGIDNNALTMPITITNNTITQSVAALGVATALIDVGLDTAFTHAAVTVSDNTITLADSFAGADAAHAILLRGGPNLVEIERNDLDGANVGTAGGTLPSSGVVVHTTDATFGALKPASQIRLQYNLITGFDNGVSVFDSAGGVFGGLPAGTTLAVNRNSLDGNASFGAQSGPTNAADATCNWWGDGSGPSGVGPGTGDAVSANWGFSPWLASSALDGSCVSLSVYEIFLTPSRRGTTAGIFQELPDILGYDLNTNTWGFLFDGSDVGLKRSIHGFTFDPFGDLLISFASNQKVQIGASKILMKPQDIVKFTPTTLGDTTSGTFTWYFDGSDVGLSTANERIDGFERLSDGRLLISTNNKAEVPGPGSTTITAEDEDILVFTPVTLGSTTSGTWALYFDGSTIPGLAEEDIIGTSVDPVTGDLFISMYSDFSFLSVSGDRNDVIRLHNTGSGWTASKYWNGEDHGYTRRIQAMHVDLP
jgi:hypothetical protein